MQHYWSGRRLAELHTDPPTMSLLELRRFVKFLPPDSNTARAVFPKTEEAARHEYWEAPADRFFLASLIDALRDNTFVQVKLHGDPKKTKRLKPPDPIPRPGVEPRRKTIKFGGRHGSGAAELAAVFGGAQQAS